MQLLTFVPRASATRRVILQPKLGGRAVAVFMITFLRAAESEAQSRWRQKSTGAEAQPSVRGPQLELQLRAPARPRPPGPRVRRPRIALAEGGGASPPVSSSGRTIKFRKFEKGGKNLPRPFGGAGVDACGRCTPRRLACGDGGHGGRTPGVQVPLRASGRQLPPQGTQPARAALAFPRGRPDPRPSRPRSGAPVACPCPFPCPRGSPLSRPSCGFCLGMCGVGVEVDFLEGSPPIPGMKGRLRERQHVHTLLHTRRECKFWSLVEVTHDLPIFLVHHPPPPKPVGVVEEITLVYSALPL